MKVFAASIFLFALFGCSPKNEDLKIVIPSSTREETKTLITANWGKVKTVCPGLNKYASSLKFDGIEDNFDIADPSAQRASVMFRVPEDSGNIPKDYFSQGNRCFFEISRDGKNAIIWKRACASICLDKRVDDLSNGALVIPLR